MKFIPLSKIAKNHDLSARRLKNLILNNDEYKENIHFKILYSSEKKVKTTFLVVENILEV